MRIKNLERAIKALLQTAIKHFFTLLGGTNFILFGGSGNFQTFILFFR